ncbi:MAG TPA: carbohydrate porin [Chthoniobacterales bacterium]
MESMILLRGIRGLKFALAAGLTLLTVAIGLLCICSLPAFAAENPSETNPPSAAPPPPSRSDSSTSAAPYHPFGGGAQFTPEQGREYWDRYLTGDWWGLRTLFHNHGVDFNLAYFSEMATNFSGGKDNFSGYPKGFGQSWAYTDQALFGIDLDFGKMIGWEGGSFEAYFTKRTGDNLSAQVNPNTLQLIQEVFGRGQTWRITTLRFKQTFFDDLFEFKLGLMNMSQEFGGFYAFPFENLTFTSGITGNVAGFSMFTWPVSQWGTDLQWNVNKCLSLRIGLFAFNNYWISNNYYLRVDNPGGTSGAVIPFEIDWNPTLDICGKDLPGQWVLGAFGNTNHLETSGAAKSVIAGAPGAPFLGSTFTGDYGVYGSIWQQVTAPDPKRPKTGLSAFAGSIWLGPQPAFQDFQAFTGLYYWGPWSKRPYDSCGIATGYNRVSGSVRSTERQFTKSHPGSGFGVQSDEFVEEIFYSFDVFRGANVQPDLQYIIHPGGYKSATNIWVFGIQLSVPL